MMRITNWGLMGLGWCLWCAPLPVGAEVGMFGYSSVLVATAEEETPPSRDYHEFLEPAITPADLPIFREATSSIAPSSSMLANGYAAAGLGQIKARSLATYPLDNTLGVASSESLVVVQETATASSTIGSPGDAIS